MIRIILLLLLFVIKSLTAQDFQGIATYKTNRKIDIKMDSTSVNSDIQKQINQMLKKQFQKEFTLSFTAEESVYKEEMNLGEPQSASGVNIVIAGSGGSDIMYKNIKEERFANQQDVFGKIFLTKDQLQKQDWQLENKTKKIGNYTCYKATYKSSIRRMQSVRVNNKQDDQEENVLPEEEITVVAWYSPEIPVSNGPGHYWGLPGLILEVNNGDQNILCNKIIINPKKKTEISEPTKGKVVTKKKLEEIMQKKMKEMEDRMPRRDDGQSIRIKIGG